MHEECGYASHHDRHEEILPSRYKSLLPIFARRLTNWFARQLKFRRDRVLLGSMSEQELKDIGLYARDLPQPGALVEENSKLTLLDGVPFSSASRTGKEIW